MTKRLTVKQAARIVFRSLPIVGQPSREGERPTMRGQCEDGPRPCPWVECRYHLAIDRTSERWGAEVVTVSGRFDWSRPTCALDCADDGPMSSRSVAAAMGLHRQAIQRIERRAMAKVRRLGLSAFASALPEEGD